MAKAKSKRERQERRFYPNASTNPKIVGVVGGLGALLAGAGAYGQFMTKLDEPLKIVPWLLAGGAALIGGAFWFGTSGEAPIRVGDAGIALEKGSTPRRMAWHAVQSLRWEESLQSIIATGHDEGGGALTIAASTKVHPLAAAWMLKEARNRVPNVVEAPEGLDEKLVAHEGGDIVKLEPVQVVGKRCAASGKIISFEPDARVCGKCERVYHKNHVPKKCDCGASLASAKGKDDEDAA